MPTLMFHTLIAVLTPHAAFSSFRGLIRRLARARTEEAWVWMCAEELR